MPTHAPIDGSVGGSGSGGGGFTPTPWVVEYAFVTTSADANAGPPVVPMPGGPTYDPKKEYVLSITNNTIPAWTSGIATGTIDYIYPNPLPFPSAGSLIEGLGQITDPVNGPIVFNIGGGPPAQTWSGAQTIGSGGIFGAAIAPGVGAGLFDGGTGLGSFGFEATTGLLSYEWLGFGSGIELYFACFSRTVQP